MDHRTDDQPHPFFGEIGVLRRREPRRRLHQPRQHRRLRRGQLLGLTGEIVERGSTQSIAIVAEIGVRQIAFENFVLGQPRFEPEGDQRLARFASQRALRGQEGEFGELLCDGAAALPPPARNIGPDGARDAARIDAPMAVKAPILDRQEGGGNMRRQFRDLDRRVDHRPHARDRRAIGGEQRDFGRRNRLERFRQRRGQCEPPDQQDESGAQHRKGPS